MATNIIPDAGFEDGTNWAFGPALAERTDAYGAHTGTYALYLQMTGGAGGFASPEDPPAADLDTISIVGQQYWFEGWFKKLSGGGVLAAVVTLDGISPNDGFNINGDTNVVSYVRDGVVVRTATYPNGFDDWVWVGMSMTATSAGRLDMIYAMDIAATEAEWLADGLWFATELRGPRVDVETPDNGQHYPALMEEWYVDPLAGVMSPESDIAIDDEIVARRASLVDAPSRGDILEVWSYRVEQDREEP